MKHLLVALGLFATMVLGVTPSRAAERRPETRLAFVVGNESYAAGALPTAANDAGLVAQTLQAAGFTVIGARDLDAETFRQSYAEFLRRVAASGPDTVAVVYVSGYGLQYGTDNYYVPIGADVSRALDIPLAAIRLSDLTGPLDALNIEARFEVFDIAYASPFHPEGAPLAGGLAAVEPVPGTLVAYNAAPGTVAAPAKGNYGLYAQSLAATMREPGLTPDEVFTRVRLRVNDKSQGAEVPWDESKIDAAFRFFERGRGAPPPVTTAAQTAALTAQPLKELPARQAYTAAIARDSVAAYGDFQEVYGNDALAKRVRILLAVRREALTWRHTVAVGTPAAYWSYLMRYPHAAHAAAAKARLAALGAQPSPPTGFAALPDAIAPPPPDELAIVDQPLVALDEAGLPPPPPPPDDWLPPIPADLLDLPAPPPAGLFFLPVPVFVALPDYCDPPPYVALPFADPFYGGLGRSRDRDLTLGNARVVSNIHRGFPAGAAGRGGESRGVALPAAAVQRAGLRAKGGAVGAGPLPMEQRLPGANGRPLPPAGAAKPGNAAAGHEATKADRGAGASEAGAKKATKASRAEKTAKAARSKRAGGSARGGKSAKAHRSGKASKSAKASRSARAKSTKGHAARAKSERAAASRSARAARRGAGQAARSERGARGAERSRAAAPARGARNATSNAGRREPQAPSPRAGAARGGRPGGFGPPARGFGRSRPGGGRPGGGMPGGFRGGGFGGPPGGFRGGAGFGRAPGGFPGGGFRGGGFFGGGRPGGFGGGGYHGGGGGFGGRR